MCAIAPGAIRRALFKLERGICQLCKLDCHALVQQLQSIRQGSHNWQEKRRLVVKRLAPRLADSKRSATLVEKLISQATEGQAWHADHILAVFEGGGACDMDNLRTLCVACHAEVTRKQASQRAAERRRRALNTPDIRSLFCGVVSGKGGGKKGMPGEGAAGGKATKRKRGDAASTKCVDATPEPQAMVICLHESDSELANGANDAHKRPLTVSNNASGVGAKPQKVPKAKTRARQKQVQDSEVVSIQSSGLTGSGVLEVGQGRTVQAHDSATASSKQATRASANAVKSPARGNVKGKLMSSMGCSKASSNPASSRSCSLELQRSPAGRSGRPAAKPGTETRAALADGCPTVQLVVQAAAEQQPDHGREQPAGTTDGLCIAATLLQDDHPAADGTHS